MKLSPNTRYAVRILFELAELEKPVSTAFLAERTGMSLRTVENIHAALRKNRITEGTVGARGGLRLVRPLSAISLGALVEMFDDGVEFAVCCGDKSNDCPNQETCGTRAVWRAISAKIQAELDAVSLESILRQYPFEAGGPLPRFPRGKE